MNIQRRVEQNGPPTNASARPLANNVKPAQRVSAGSSTPKKLGWGKLAIYFFTVLLPAIAVGISSWYVFRDSFSIAVISLIITCGVAGLFTFYSGAAMAEVRRYCIIADIAICCVLVANFCCHFIMAREISSAKESTVERHLEEDRGEQFKNNDAARQAQIMASSAQLAQSQAMLEKSQALKIDAAKRAGLPPPRIAPIASLAVPASPAGSSLQGVSPAASVPSGAPTKPPTPDDVRAAWNPWLTFLAFLDVIVSVLAGALLAAVWQWDRNGDGINDALQPELFGGKA